MPGITFYDRNGTAVAYSDDGAHVFLFGGEAVGYLEADALYSYRGELMGWFEKGWLRDKDGRCVAYSDKAAGGPPQAARLEKPYQSRKQAMPAREHQDPRSLRPIHSNVWSSQSAQEFFSRLRHAWPGSMGKPSDSR